MSAKPIVDKPIVANSKYIKTIPMVANRKPRKQGQFPFTDYDGKRLIQKQYHLLQIRSQNFRNQARGEKGTNPKPAIDLWYLDIKSPKLKEILCLDKVD